MDLNDYYSDFIDFKKKGRECVIKWASDNCMYLTVKTIAFLEN